LQPCREIALPEAELETLPAVPETVAAFVASEASRGIKPSSIGRRIAAIRYAHKLAGCDTLPTDSEMVRAMAQAAPDTPDL
jgi:hypothetical protein